MRVLRERDVRGSVVMNVPIGEVAARRLGWHSRRYAEWGWLTLTIRLVRRSGDESELRRDTRGPRDGQDPVGVRYMQVLNELSVDGRNTFAPSSRLFERSNDGLRMLNLTR